MLEQRRSTVPSWACRAQNILGRPPRTLKCDRLVQPLHPRALQVTPIIPLFVRSRQNSAFYHPSRRRMTVLWSLTAHILGRKRPLSHRCSAHCSTLLSSTLRTERWPFGATHVFAPLVGDVEHPILESGRCTTLPSYSPLRRKMAVWRDLVVRSSHQKRRSQSNPLKCQLQYSAVFLAAAPRGGRLVHLRFLISCPERHLPSPAGSAYHETQPIFSPPHRKSLVEPGCLHAFLKTTLTTASLLNAELSFYAPLRHEG